MNYIDCHSHLLPGVDDGAQEPEEAKDKLRLLRSQGVATAILTPHVNSAFGNRTLTKEELRRRFSSLKEACEKEPGAYPVLTLGCEYYLDPYSEDSIDPITMAGSDVVMMELPYSVGLTGVIRAVNVARGQGYRVLLAHPEKYYAFQSQWDKALGFLRSSPDVFVQTEAWDIGQHKEYAWRFIKSRASTVIGTDSHGYRRFPVYDLAVAALTEWAGEDPERRDYTERLLRLNAQEIFFS